MRDPVIEPMLLPIVVVVTVVVVKRDHVPLELEIVDLQQFEAVFSQETDGRNRVEKS